MIVFLVALFCLIGASPAQRLHEKMTQEELLKVFHTTENVPKYEVVPIFWPKSHRRSQTMGAEVALTAFGEDIKLQLHPVDGVLAGYNTPVYMARKNGTGGMKLDKYPNLLKDIHTQMYEDFEKSATVVVSQKDDGKKKIVGTIGSKNLAIKPLPERVVKEEFKQRASIDKIQYHDDYHYHIVHKIQESNESDLIISELKSPEGDTVPNTVYPEILVVLDHTLYQKLGGNVWEAIPYVLAFWNGVDIKYRTLDKPKWRLNIAALVIAEDPVLTYMEINRREKVMVVFERALDESGSFWYQQHKTIPIDSYDLISTMTSHHLCSYDGTAKYCDGGYLGVAYYACACRINTQTENLAKVSLVFDEGTYDGIHTAAHELGHLFGADHDTNDADGCSYHDGYIMAASPMFTPKSHYWSNCSAQEMKKFVNSNLKCLYNKPKVDSNLPTIWPGKYLDADAQCSRAGYGKACATSFEFCNTLKCIDNNNGYCKATGSIPADGTKCKEGRICFRGECVID